MPHLRPFLALILAAVAFAATPSDYVVQVQAATKASPPTVTLTWLNVPGGSGYHVKRRAMIGNADFASVGPDLPVTASTWTDNAVSIGTSYEYQVVRAAGADAKKNPLAYGYVAVAIDLPLVDHRGGVALLVDDTQAAPLAKELTQLQADLVGDGWTVIRHDVARSTASFGPGTWSTGSDGDHDQTAIPAIKARLAADAKADPALSHVLIIGNVPVPYSGNLSPDGHGQHIGAWPADVYYGDLDGAWTDTTVNTPYKFPAGGDNNANLVGDGRFDQSTIPGSGRQLAVGRVDLSRLPAFAPATETDLLRRYLAKDHAWRTGQWQVEEKCLVDDATLGDLGGWAVAGANGWLTASTVGLGNVVQGDWMTSLPTTSFLFAEGGGWGTLGDKGWSCAGVVTTRDLVAGPSLGVFTMLFGSYFIDWNRSDDLLRAVLANDGYGLTCEAAGRPNVVFHRMALGATIGDNWRLTQAADASRYPDLGGLVRSVHLGLLGDPTLRAHPLAPPGPPRAVVDGGRVKLDWRASTGKGVIGYHVYRATSANGPFVRVSGVAASAGHPSGTPVTGTTWTDSAPPTGTQHYLIKAIGLQTTPGGTFFNSSLGAAVTATTGS